MNDTQRALIIQRVAAFLAAHDAEAYLVGGPVRDMLLGRPAHDLDFVVTRGDSLALARALADELDEPFVLLDKDLGTARVVIRKSANEQMGKWINGQMGKWINGQMSKWVNGQMGKWANGPIYLDFNRLRAPTLHDDLLARDFTVNAIAATLPWATEPSPAHLVDPLGGQRDLERRLIRVVSDRAFQDDPLRMLRAVRQAVALDFTIDPDTQALIRRQAPLIDQPAAERVRDELVKLFAQPHAIGGLETLDRLDLLTRIVPELGLTKGMAQPQAHQWDVFHHMLEAVRALEWLLARLRGQETTLPWAPDLPVDRDALQADRVLAHLDAPSSAAGTRAVLLKFAALLHDIAKPQCRSLDVGNRIRFFQHETEGAPMAATVMRRLRFSSREANAVANIVAQHMRPAQLVTTPNVTSRAIRRFLRAAGDETIDLLLLSLCDHLATQGPRVQPLEWERHVAATGDMLATYFCRRERSTTLPRLLNGHDLMTAFGLEPGQQIGALLADLREAQLLGQVSTRDEALAWAAARLEEGDW